MKIMEALKEGKPVVVGAYLGRNSSDRPMQGVSSSGKPFNKVFYTHTIMAGYPDKRDVIQLEEIVDKLAVPAQDAVKVPDFGALVVALVEPRGSGKAKDYEAVIGLSSLHKFEPDDARAAAPVVAGAPGK